MTNTIITRTSVILILAAAIATLVVGTASALSTVTPVKSLLSSTGQQLLKSGGDESAWIKSFCNAKECPPTIVDIKIPSDFPTGPYYRNGGGWNVAQDGTKTMLMFDADGLINAVTFNEDGKVIFRNKFVQTDDFKVDMKIGGFSARGVFGTKKSGGFMRNVFDMKVKNVANTNLLVCGEGGVPYELGPKTLLTIGKKDDIQTSFSAHPRFNRRKNVQMNDGVGDPDPASGFTDIFLYEMDADTGVVISKPVSLKVTGVGLMHDSALTENYIILSWKQCNLDSVGGLKALLGVGALAGALALDEGGKHVILCIPRSLLEPGVTGIDALNDERIKRVESEFSFAFLSKTHTKTSKDR